MNLKNTEYKGVPIPAGFAPTRIEGENTVEDGLVIIDSEGNEFVWIPVSTDDYTNYENADKLSTSESGERWSSNAYDQDAEYANGNPSLMAKKGWKNPDDQMKAAKESIEKYKGFYVARYEAGVPTNASFYVPSNSSSNEATYAEEGKEKDTDSLATRRNVTKTENEVDLKPVSKKGNQVWNFISQENAVKLSNNMYKGSASVNSYLIDSNAWNYICKYIFEEKKGINLTESSSKYGNYYDNTTTNYEGIRGLFALHTLNNPNWTYATQYEYGNIPSNYHPKGNGNNKLELATGICNDFKIYNIYDMAGNIWEWTAETVKHTDEKDYAVMRGGSYNFDVDHFVVRSTGHAYISTCGVNVGFRCVLYLK